MPDPVFHVRDVVTIISSVVAVSVVFITMRSKVKALEEKVKLLTAVIFDHAGKMQIVDNCTCSDHRDRVAKEITRTDHVVRRAFISIDLLNENIIKIMMHMNITPRLKRDEHGPDGVDQHE